MCVYVPRVAVLWVVPSPQLPDVYLFLCSSQLKLYVGNLSWDTQRDDLYQLFGTFGTVSDAFIPTDRETGRPRGFGFVTLDSAGAQAAMSQLNETGTCGDVAPFSFASGLLTPLVTRLVVSLEVS